MEKVNVNRIQKSHETEEGKVETLQKMLDKLPPIVLADMGDYYEVLDGNHRVEAAKMMDEDLELKAIIVPNEVAAYAEEYAIEQMSTAAAAYRREGFDSLAEEALEANGNRDDMEEILEYWNKI